MRFLRLFLALLIVALSGSCNQPAPPLGPVAARSIPALGRAYLDSIGLTAATLDSVVIDRVTAANLDGWVADIVDAISGVDGDQQGAPVVYRFADLREQVSRQDAIDDFKRRDMIEVGDDVVRTTWTLPGLSPVETYGLESSDGDYRFEPVIHLGSGPGRSFAPPAVPGSWSARGIWMSFENFVKTHAKGVWDVVVDCSGCSIIGPPLPVIQRACEEGFLFDVACTEGYKKYPRPNPSCPSGAEECIQWVLELAFTRLDNIVVEAGAGGSWNGVRLNAKIRADSIGWGNVYHQWGILCAKSGDLNGSGFFSQYAAAQYQTNAAHGECLEKYEECTDLGGMCVNEGPVFGTSWCQQCYGLCRRNRTGQQPICAECGFD